MASSSATFLAHLDRLNAELRSGRPGPVAARYEAVARPGRPRWELRLDGEALRRCDTLLDAVSYVEWHMCGQAIERRPDLVHVHGAALAGPWGSVLLPGRSGVGKTSLALALALRGLRLLADDVVFLHPATWRPEPFPRSFPLPSDALSRLAELGLRDGPRHRLGAYLCATILAPWDRAPGPPVRYLVFPRSEPRERPALEPLTHAEAAVELMRYSRNLRRFPRFGLDLLPGLLAHTECYVLRRNDDLAAAAELVFRLVAEGRPRARPEPRRARGAGAAQPWSLDSFCR